MHLRSNYLSEEMMVWGSSLLSYASCVSMYNTWNYTLFIFSQLKTPVTLTFHWNRNWNWFLLDFQCILTTILLLVHSTLDYANLGNFISTILIIYNYLMFVSRLWVKVNSSAVYKPVRGYFAAAMYFLFCFVLFFAV